MYSYSYYLSYHGSDISRSLLLFDQILFIKKN